MIAFLVAPENLGFVVALIVMALIGAIELVGLGAAGVGADLDLDGHAPLLGWLGVGRLPLTVLLVLLLFLFGALGLVGQRLAEAATGALLPGWMAMAGAGAAALVGTGLLSRPLARILPRDETTAIALDSLVGRHAEIVVGTARAGQPARARLRDDHGQTHHVMVEPTDPAIAFAEGDEVLLVAREPHLFRAVASERRAFTDWIVS